MKSINTLVFHICKEEFVLMAAFRNQLSAFVQHSRVLASCNDNLLGEAQVAPPGTRASRFLSDLPPD